MNWLDIVIIVVLAVGAFYGLKMGLIKALLSLVGLVLGIFLAGQFYEQVGGMLSFIESEGVANGVGFAIILIVVMLAASIAAAILKWATNLIMLGWVNHLGGAVFGLFMGAMLCGSLLTLWANFMDPPQVVVDSAFSGFLLDGFPAVLALLPSEFDSIREFFN